MYLDPYKKPIPRTRRTLNPKPQTDTPNLQEPTSSDPEVRKLDL